MTSISQGRSKRCIKIYKGAKKSLTERLYNFGEGEIILSIAQR